jgi:hypothetical protein
VNGILDNGPKIPSMRAPSNVTVAVPATRRSDVKRLRRCAIAESSGGEGSIAETILTALMNNNAMANREIRMSRVMLYASAHVAKAPMMITGTSGAPVAAAKIIQAIINRIMFDTRTLESGHSWIVQWIDRLVIV